MTDNPRLVAFGLADIAIGAVLWVVTDSATVGLALILAGVAVLVVAAVRSGGTPPDPDQARRNEQADEEREAGRTNAETQNLEDRGQSHGA